MKMENKFYITTPIYYVNDVPHIGHAYTSIAADVLASHYAQTPRGSFFLTGTDEHGAKIAEAACKAGKTPQEFVDGLEKHYKDAWNTLNVSYDEFIRTTNPGHEQVVIEVIERLKEKGYVEKRNYEGLYCIGCEKYLAEGDLVDGKCPDHQKEPIKQSEENYFFLLSKAAKDFNLYEKIEKDEIKVRPKARKNEVLGKIKAGLEDVSMSRENVEWGIKFPGDAKQTIYVWIDALINYYSAAKIFGDQVTWPADLHLMAKDILWFHAIIWPSLLMAIDEKPPKQVFAHGFFTINGQKMSKTLGNTLNPVEMAEKYGADAVRFALLREFPFGEDGDISEEKIARRYETDLGNDLGNLLQRTISMINRYEVSVAKPDQLSIDDHDRNESIRDLVSAAIETLRFNEALEVIWKIINDCDVQIENDKPWQLAKDGEESRLFESLSFIYQNLCGISELLVPFMPETAAKMKNQLETLEPEPLFPRLEK
jgi:methionyl-tRNA synthetase